MPLSRAGGAGHGLEVVAGRRRPAPMTHRVIGGRQDQDSPEDNTGRNTGRRQEKDMLLENRNAVVYGGAGAVGSVVARAFARAGARVFLAGRTSATLQAVAESIRSAGGAAETAVVDSLADRVVAEAGSLDISFNLIDVQDVQGTPLAEMSWEDFDKPVATAVRSTFLTARAAARQMIRQRSGVILTFGGGGARNPIRHYSIGGFIVALAAVDTLRRQLAAELGEYGIRVLTIETGGLLETHPKDFPGRDDIADMLVEPTMLGHAATLEDIGNVAVFAASDLARSMTGTILNTTCGASVD